jgi:hypothetical protein
MTTAGVGLSASWIRHLTVARVLLYTLCWELSRSVFLELIKDLYIFAMPGEVVNLCPVAVQQDVFLPPPFV